MSWLNKAGSFLKDMAVDFVGTGKAVGAHLWNTATPWDMNEPGGNIMEVEFGGKKFKTPTYHAIEAGKHLRKKEYEQAGGELLWAGLDILSTSPFGAGAKVGKVGLSAAKTAGKSALKTAGKDVLRTEGKSLFKSEMAKNIFSAAKVSGAYSAGYGASEVMQNGGSGADIAAATFRGGATGFVAGAGFGIAATALGKAIGKTLFHNSSKIAKDTDPKNIAKIFEKEGATKKESTKMAEVFKDVPDEMMAYDASLSTKVFRTVEELTGKEPNPKVKQAISERIAQITKGSNDLMEHQMGAARILHDVVSGAIEKEPKIAKHYEVKAREYQTIADKKTSYLADKKTGVKIPLTPKQKRALTSEKIIQAHTKLTKEAKYDRVARKYKTLTNFRENNKKLLKGMSKEKTKKLWENAVRKNNKYEARRKSLVRKVHEMAKIALPTDRANKILARLKSSEVTTSKGFSKIVADIAKEEAKYKKAKVQAKKAKVVKHIKKKYVSAKDSKRVIPFKRMPEVIAKKMEGLKKSLRKTKDIDEQVKIAKEIKAEVDKLVPLYKKAQKDKGTLLRQEAAKMETGFHKAVRDRVREIFGLGNLKEDYYKAALSGKDMSKKIAQAKKVLTKLKSEDVLMPESHIKAVTDKSKVDAILPMSAKEMRLTPISKLEEMYHMDKIFGKKGSLATKAKQSFAVVANVKKKHEVLRRMLDSTQADERLHTQNLVKHEEKSDKMFKGWKKETKKKNQFESLNKMFNALENKKVKLNNTEKKIVDMMRKDYDKSKSFMEKFIPDFKGRKNYAPHIKKEYGEFVKKYGWKEGTRQFMEQKDLMKALGGETRALQFLHNNVSDTLKAGFLNKRTGKLEHSTNVFNAYDAYMTEFLRLKYINETTPKISAIQSITNTLDGASPWLEQHKVNIKGRPRGDFDRAMMKVADVNYLLKLSVRLLSGFKNFVGGTTNTISHIGYLRWAKGMLRVMTKPKLIHKYYIANGMDIGSFNELGKGSSWGRNATAKLKGAAFWNQSIAEHMIRQPLMAGMISGKNLRAFEKGNKLLSNKKYLKVMDAIEKTQGIFTSSRTPDFFQTGFGRTVGIFGRWKFTDAPMVYNYLKDTTKLLKKGQRAKGRKNLARLARVASLYAIGGMTSSMLAKAGYDKLAKAMEGMKEPVRVLADPTTFLDVFSTEGANLDLIQQTNNSARIALYYMGISKRPYNMENLNTLRDVYLSPIAALEDFGFINPKKPKARANKIYKMSPYKQIQELNKIKISEPEIYKSTKRYLKWKEIGLTDQEQTIYYIRDEEEKIKYTIKYLKQLSPYEQALAIRRMKKTKTINQKQLKKISAKLRK